MTPRVKAAVVMMVVVSGLAVGLLVVLPLPSLLHHYEVKVQEGRNFFAVTLSDLEDTNLSITFVDDPSLLYTMDIALYEPATPAEAYGYHPTSSYYPLLEAKVRIRSLNVTLGTGVEYFINLDGINLNSMIIFDNGAISEGYTLNYQGTGRLDLVLTENITLTRDISLSVGGRDGFNYMTFLHLDVDLPPSVGGSLFFSDATIAFTENVGWEYDGISSYRTPSGSPRIEIYVGRCHHIYARLHD
ncbi:MAG: hypothetical protein ACP6KW_05445 [Candidatus Thorarchaeota archaeon]